MNRILRFGFGGLLVLIVASGAAMLDAVERLLERDRAARTELVERSQALQRVREAIYLSGTFARDSLLDPDRAAAEGLRTELLTLQAQTERAIERCLRGARPADVPVLLSLHGEIASYWKVLSLMLEVRERERRPGVDQYFYRALAGRRVAILSIADRAAALSEQQWAEEQARLRSLSGDFRHKAFLILLAILAAGCALALFAGRRLLGLEREAHERRQDLAALSSRLVKAQEEERKAVARELHDQVGQSLSALSVEAGNALRTPEPRPHLESIRALADGCVSVVRNMALALRPSMLDDFGLIAALEWHARELSKRTALKVQLDAEESAAELPDEIKTCIYRVTQEALANCARHAQAHRVVLKLQQSEVDVTLTIADDGKGFDPARTRGLGLLGMKERVEDLGGRLLIESTPGAGTRLSVALPLQPARAHAA